MADLEREALTGKQEKNDPMIFAEPQAKSS